MAIATRNQVRPVEGNQVFEIEADGQKRLGQERGGPA